MNDDLLRSLEGFASIGLEDVRALGLLTRRDTKFALSISALHEILPEITGSYRLLRMDDAGILPYETQYFDTREYRSYLDHHNGRTRRYKIRKRKYVSSNVLFVEVKQKLATGQTVKSRQTTTAPLHGLAPEDLTFVGAQLPERSGDLHATLWNSYTRMTLAHELRRERVTLDFDLSFAAGALCTGFPELVVVEVKRESSRAVSPVLDILKRKHIAPISLSKYCVGMALLGLPAKTNALKPTLRMLERIAHGYRR